VFQIRCAPSKTGTFSVLVVHECCKYLLGVNPQCSAETGYRHRRVTHHLKKIGIYPYASGGRATLNLDSRLWRSSLGRLEEHKPYYFLEGYHELYPISIYH
jgi:hypothetical protein